MKLWLSMLFAAVSLLACHPTPNPSPPTDADGATFEADDPADCQAMCVNLARFPECSSASGPNCIASCEHVIADRVTLLHPGQVARANSVDEVRAIGPAIRCTP